MPAISSFSSGGFDEEFIFELDTKDLAMQARDLGWESREIVRRILHRWGGETRHEALAMADKLL